MRIGYTKTELNLAVAVFGILVIAFGHGLSWYEQILPDLYLVEKALAKGTTVYSTQTELEVVDTPAVVETPQEAILEQPDTIEDKIRRVFGSEADNALKIAQCESQMNPDVIGDTHLTYVKDGATYGDSIGLFQIRTFVNRPDRELLKDADFNIGYAKKMFDAQGWHPWTCKRVIIK